MQKVGIAAGFQHQPVGVGNDHNGGLTRNLRAQLLDQRLYPLRYPVVATAQLVEQSGFDKRDMLIGARQAVAPAALPGFRQRMGQQTGALSGQAVIRQHAFLPPFASVANMYHRCVSVVATRDTKNHRQRRRRPISQVTKIPNPIINNHF